MVVEVQGLWMQIISNSEGNEVKIKNQKKGAQP